MRRAGALSGRHFQRIVAKLTEPARAGSDMPDKFDPYREALVMETLTTWPEDCDLDERQKDKIAAALHADPENASSLTYVRMHTGFRREITATAEDIQRLQG